MLNVPGMRREVSTRRLQILGMCLPGVAVPTPGMGLIFLQDTPGFSILDTLLGFALQEMSVGTSPPLLGGFPSHGVTQELQVALCPSVPLPSPFLPLFPLFLPPPPAWPRLDHLPLFSCPSLLPPPSPPGLLRCWSSCFHGNVSPAPHSCTFIPGMSLHRSPAVPSSSGWKPQLKWPPKPPESLKSWCGHPGWGQRARAGLSMAGGSSLTQPQLGFVGMSPWMVTPHPSSLCLGMERAHNLDLSFASLPRALK